MCRHKPLRSIYTFRKVNEFKMEEFSLLRESKEITLLHNSIKIQLSVRKRKQHKIKPSVMGLYENFVYVDMASLGFIGPP